MENGRRLLADSPRLSKRLRSRRGLRCRLGQLRQQLQTLWTDCLAVPTHLTSLSRLASALDQDPDLRVRLVAWPPHRGWTNYGLSQLGRSPLSCDNWLVMP